MGTTMLAWWQIANMAVNIPVEHTKQVAVYKEQMQCLREKKCYTILDTRDNTWIIRRKEVEVQEVKVEDIKPIEEVSSVQPTLTMAASDIP